MTTRKLLQIGLAALLATFTSAAQARHQADIGLIDVDIVSDYGRSYDQYPVTATRGADEYRAYVEARPDEQYSIRVRNRSGERIGLVIAVDGRNIVSGKKSYLRNSERMYILGPYDTATYEGWRTGRNRVNRFYFTDVEDSYADAFGDRSAMGVISVAAFREKDRPRRYDDLHSKRQRESGKSAGDGAAKGAPSTREKSGRFANESAQPGTGFGDEHYSPSTRVHFEPERRVAAEYFLKYEWRRMLCEKGIASCGRDRNRFWPHRYDDRHGFAPYPPNRSRFRRSGWRVVW